MFFFYIFFIYSDLQCIICLLLHLQILESSTCKVMHEFKSHSSRVKWCTFTKCSQLVVSVSEDCTAKVII